MPYLWESGIGEKATLGYGQKEGGSKSDSPSSVFRVGLLGRCYGAHWAGIGASAAVNTKCRVDLVDIALADSS